MALRFRAFANTINMLEATILLADRVLIHPKVLEDMRLVGVLRSYLEVWRIAPHQFASKPGAYLLLEQVLYESIVYGGEDEKTGTQGRG